MLSLLSPCTQTFWKSVWIFVETSFFIPPSCFSGNIKNKHTQLCHRLPATFFQQTPRVGNSAGCGLQKPKLPLPNSFSPSSFCATPPPEPAGRCPGSGHQGQRALELLPPPWDRLPPRPCRELCAHVIHPAHEYKFIAFASSLSNNQNFLSMVEQALCALRIPCLEITEFGC